MPTWDELQKTRKPVSSMRSSQQVLKAAAAVLKVYRDAAIVKTEKGFKLVAEGKDLSSEYNSHHDCWVEAANGV